MKSAMHITTKWLVLACALAANLFCGMAHADALADLKSALLRLQGQAPLKATLDLKNWHRLGEGKEASETEGRASLAMDDGPRGLQVLYGKDMLARIESEASARGKNPDAKTPTQDAVRELDAAGLRSVVSAAPALLREIDGARYTGEKIDAFGGKPARQLSFEFSIANLSERERKYAKKFEGNLDIWIAEDGTPLASRMRQSASGRAFVVVGFEQQMNEDRVFGLVGDRLYTQRKETHSSSAGAGIRSESRVVRSLQLSS
jgi:hypothetical protein